MKLLKKISYVLVAVAILVMEVGVPNVPKVDAKAKTLRSMKAELAELEK